MSDTRTLLEAAGIDAFGTAVGLAVISGALAILTPFLAELTAALAALALAAWLVAGGGTVALRHRLPSGGWWAFVPLAAGAGVFLGFSSVPVGERALLLGLSLVPLWVAERRRRNASPELETEP